MCSKGSLKQFSCFVCMRRWERIKRIKPGTWKNYPAWLVIRIKLEFQKPCTPRRALGECLARVRETGGLRRCRRGPGRSRSEPAVFPSSKKILKIKSQIIEAECDCDLSLSPLLKSIFLCLLTMFHKTEIPNFAVAQAGTLRSPGNGKPWESLSWRLCGQLSRPHREARGTVTVFRFWGGRGNVLSPHP